jgi:hypothetical protein
MVPALTVALIRCASDGRSSAGSWRGPRRGLWQFGPLHLADKRMVRTKPGIHPCSIGMSRFVLSLVVRSFRAVHCLAGPCGGQYRLVYLADTAIAQLAGRKHDQKTTLHRRCCSDPVRGPWRCDPTLCLLAFSCTRGVSKRPNIKCNEDLFCVVHCISSVRAYHTGRLSAVYGRGCKATPAFGRVGRGPTAALWVSRT